MLNGNENLNFLWWMNDRGNGKCAMERELLKKVKLIKYLKKELGTMYDSSYNELNRVDKETDKSYIRGYQDAITTVMWHIDVGEHKDEN